MRRLSCNLISCSLLIFLISACSQWGGDNPLGITGGSKEGYGQNGDLFLPGEIDQEILGSWIISGEISYQIFTFYADGTFSIENYLEDQLARTVSGLWGVSGHELTLRSGGKSEVYRYQVNSNELILSYGIEQIVLYRRIRKIE
jgi:hypothetical protein